MNLNGLGTILLQIVLTLMVVTRIARELSQTLGADPTPERMLKDIPDENKLGFRFASGVLMALWASLLTFVWRN